MAMSVMLSAKHTANRVLLSALPLGWIYRAMRESPLAARLTRFVPTALGGGAECASSITRGWSLAPRSCISTELGPPRLDDVGDDEPGRRERALPGLPG